MPETNNKYALIFDGLELEAEDITDKIPFGLPEHEFDGVDGASLEPTGQKARTIQFRAWFLNERYPEHKDFLEKLKGQAWKPPFEMIHPMYGIMYGYVGDLTVRHEYDDTSCSVDVVFKETIEKKPEPWVTVDIGGEVEAAYVDGIRDQEEEYGYYDLIDDLGTDGADLMETEIGEDEGILEKFAAVTGTVREYVGKVDSAVNHLDAAMNQVSSVANSITGTIDFATNLPGRVIGSIANVCDRVAGAYQSLRNAPDLFVQNFKGAMDQLDASLAAFDTSSDTEAKAIATVRKHLKTTGAMTAALHIGLEFARDEGNRDLMRKSEASTGATPPGVSALASPPDVLTVRDIEDSLASTRAYLQEAVDVSRGQGSLKRLADILLQHATAVKLEKEKIRTVVVDNPIPIHRLCQVHGLPYTYATRILALNPQIHNPNFVTGEVKVYVR